MRRAAVLPLWLAAALALAHEPGPAEPSAPAPEPFAFLQVTDTGCSAAAGTEARTEWPREGRAVHRTTAWLNSRERVFPGPVEIERMDGRITAWIPVALEPVREGEPVATCIRPVQLELTVEPLPRADYEWNLQRGDRPAAESVPEAAAETARD